jgi:hypothetical protein
MTTIAGVITGWWTTRRQLIKGTSANGKEDQKGDSELFIAIRGMYADIRGRVLNNLSR